MDIKLNESFVETKFFFFFFAEETICRIMDMKLDIEGECWGLFRKLK